MNILITGANGFIGKYLVKLLCLQGHNCRCLIRDINKIDQTLCHPNVEIFKGDVTNPDSLANIGKGIEVVYHLAAAGHVAAVSEQANKDSFNLNVIGTQNLLTACGKGDVKRFIHFSSTAAMGLPNTTIIDETALCNPVTPYQKSKYQSECVALETGTLIGINVIVLRPCMVYGPGGQGEFLKFCRLIKKGVFPRIGMGKNLAPIVHVEDVVQAAVNTLENGVSGETYLIASEYSPKLSEIHRLICQAQHIHRLYFYVPLWLAYVAGYFFEKISVITGKAPLVSRKNIVSTAVDRIFDISKAKRDLNYSPLSELKLGIEETVRWYFEGGLL